jgi:ribosomal protein L37AE/L43A
MAVSVMAMSEHVYVTNRYDTEAYHESSDCFQLQGSSDTRRLPADWARESTQLSPCTACQASGETVNVCPECSATKIHARVHRSRDEAWHCYRCKEEFREPDTRESEKMTKHRHGLAGDLVDADPEQVSR